MAAVEKVHDLIGTVVMTVLIGGIWFAGRLLRGPRGEMIPAKEQLRARLGALAAGWRQARFPNFWLVVLVALLSFLAAQFLNARLEARDQTQREPFFAVQPSFPGNSRVEVPREIMRALNPTSGEYIRREDASLPRGTGDGYHFFWKPSPWNRFVLVHRPDICMPGIGWQLAGPPEPVEVKFGARTLLFHAFRFQRGDLHALALWGAWRNGDPVLIDYQPDEVLGAGGAPPPAGVAGKTAFRHRDRGRSRHAKGGKARAGKCCRPPACAFRIQGRVNENMEKPRLSDRAQRRLRQKRRTLILVASGLVFVLLLFTARPAYRWFKERRANQFAAQAEELVAEGKMAEAAAKYRAALQLDKLGYRPLAGAARLATRLNRPEAEGLWQEVMKLPQRSPADRQEYISLLLQKNRFRTAEDQLKQLLRVQADARAMMLAARYKLRVGDVAKAIEFGRAGVRMEPKNDAVRFQLAEALASATEPALRAEARSILWEMTQREGSFRAAALEGLAQAPELTQEERRTLLGTFEALKDPTANQAVFAAELRLQLNPGESEQIYDKLSARLGQGDEGDLNELARWLNLHKQYGRVLKMVPEEKAKKSSDLILSRLDALAGLEKWAEIDTMLGSPEVNLTPAVIEAFRARAALGRNDTLNATLHWNRALSASGDDPERLRLVAHFAEQSGANEIAARAFEQLSRSPEHAAFAFRGMQRLADKRGDSVALRSVSDRLAEVTPEDADAQNQAAYMNLLLKNDVEKNAAVARRLVEKHPTRLAFRVTAALGALRQHNAAGALAQFEGPEIEWRRTPPAWRAVYVAALLANDQSARADSIRQTIDPAGLKPEERALLERAAAPAQG